MEGAAPADLKRATDGSINSESEDANFYLYNVGTGKFLTVGGNWGTQAVLKDVGLLLTLDNSIDGTKENGSDVAYSIHTKYSVSTVSKNYVQLMDGSSSTSEHDEGIWYTDRLYNPDAGDNQIKDDVSEDLATFYFHSIGDNKYNIYVRSDHRGITVGDHEFEPSHLYDRSRVYLVAPQNAANNDPVGIEKTNYDDEYQESDVNAQWMLIPLSEVRANFQMEAANATEQYPADGSYIIHCQNFSRNNGDLNQWRIGNVSASATLNTDVYEKKYFPENNNYMLAPSENPFNYYVGNGYYVGDDGSSTNGYDRRKYYKDGFNSGEENLMSSGGDSHQKNYGGYWTANIKGPGTIWQQIYTPITKAGWYIVSCDGFTTATKGNVYIFAATTTMNFATDDVSDFKNPDSYNFRSFNKGTTPPATYTQAGKQLMEGNNNKKSVMLYIDPNDAVYNNKPVYLIMGVQATGEEGTTYTQAVESTAWTCIDNFEVKFAGSQEKVIVLDEDQTSVDYINTQVNAISDADDAAGDTKQYYTLCLGRSITVGQWSSLILPVDLTAYQLKMGFGQDTKLSVKNKEVQSSNSVIEFVSVPLNVADNEVVLKAGTPYIIKPSNINYAGTDGDEATATPATSVDCIDGEAWAIGKHIEINQVRLENILGSADIETGPYDCKDGGSLTFNGTYTKQENKIPHGSYLLSGGKWFYMNLEGQETPYVKEVKGFRTWLQPDGSTQGNANIQFSIDGVIDGDVTNAIEGIENDINVNANSNKVYNMNGQLVRNGSTSLEGLPKGVYIVNNKKYIVK